MFKGENRTSFKLKKDSQLFILCSNCGYSFCPGNYRDDVKTLKRGCDKNNYVARIGDGITPGREYFMAMNAIGILNKNKLRVLIFGPGFNKDHILIRKHDLVSECKIMDLKNFQNSEYFVPIDTKEVFDIVIACEVIEHFADPRKEFSSLISYLDKDGLLIISTCMRLHQGGDHAYNLYPFLHGHMSYYSFASLICLARMNNFYIDFRIPIGWRFLSRSKRYVYMTRSKDVYFAVLNYSLAFPNPPSEYGAMKVLL